MTRGKKTIPPAYLEQVLEMYLAGERPVGVYAVTVRHDDWCDLLNGRGPCNCDPQVDEPEQVQ